MHLRKGAEPAARRGVIGHDIDTRALASVGPVLIVNMKPGARKRQFDGRRLTAARDGHEFPRRRWRTLSMALRPLLDKLG